MNYVLLLLLLLAVIAGCAPVETNEPASQPALLAVDELKAAEQNFKDYMEENFKETQWMSNILSYGISQDNTGKVVLGVVLQRPNAYQEMQMPITLWVTNDSPVDIDELWFMYDKKIVHRVRW